MSEPIAVAGPIYEGLDERVPDTAVSVILKLRGETCDIDCLYCYEKRKEAPGGARVTAEHVSRLPEIFAGRPLVVELHGGEPLTAGKESVREVLAELATQPSVVRVSLQTNGVQLDESWLDLFDEVYPGLHIGISLDGDPDGNAWRVGYDGQPVYQRVTRALHLLAERGRRVGVITAVTPRLLGRAEAIIDHLAGFAAVDAVSLVPCFDAGVRRPTRSPGARTPNSRRLQLAAVSEDAPPDWAITPDQYADFVLDAAVHWVSSGASRRLKLEPVVSTIRRLHGLESSFCHFSGLKCDHVFTLYPDGRFGSCDELPWPPAHLASLDQLATEADVRAAQATSALLAEGHELTNRCVTCDYRGTCAGGCIATRWRMASAGDEDAYCSHRMRLIDGVAALVAQPQAPAGVRCCRLHARPRTPNTMADVSAFLGRWRDPNVDRPAVVLVRSSQGNLNSTGSPGVQPAPDLDPGHPQWSDGIEPGVRPLVDVLTRDWNLVTYDSCEGHVPADRTMAVPPTERRVGVLPRSREEYAVAAAALCRATAAVAHDLPRSIRVVVGRADLTCERSGRRWPVLDVALTRVPTESWARYFADLDGATAQLADALGHHRPDPSLGCACETRGVRR
jgi:uncharacterized protein